LKKEKEEKEKGCANFFEQNMAPEFEA